MSQKVTDKQYFKLPIFDIEVKSNKKDISISSITISDDSYEKCSKCGRKSCLYNCDNGEDIVDEHDRIRYNSAIDTILSIILAHAVAGINIESKAYLEGIETAFDATVNIL